MTLFDTHAHYTDNAFGRDRTELLGQLLPAAGVAAAVTAGVDVESSRASIALAEEYHYIYAAAGIHPGDCAGAGEAELAEIRTLCRHPKVIAVGEIGLDYYWAENPPREFQQEIFRQQLALAREEELPAIVHDREAHGDSMAEELVRRGLYLGFDGPITYKNAKRAPEVAAVTPLERIVIETDAPYLSPVPNRGKRNDSRNLPYIVEKLAEWKGVTPEEMAQITFENALRLFPKARDAG